MSHRPLEWWDRFFFEPQSTAPMTLVRVVWGAVTAVWAVSLLPDIDPFFTEGALLYERDLRDGSWNLLPHLGGQAGLTICVLLLLASLSTMVGLKTRLSAAIAVLCLVVLQRGNSAIFNSGDLLLRLVGIAVVLSPCGLRWSVDAAIDRRRGHVRSLLRAPFGMRLLQLQLAVGYLLSAWTKTRGTTWEDGTAIARSLRIEDLQRFVAPDWLVQQELALRLLTWSTLAFEATFIVLVWPRRLRLWVLGTGVLLHLSIDVFLDIGFFSLAVYVAYLAFLPAELAGARAAPVRRRPQRARCRRATPEPSRSSQPRSTATARGSCLSRWPAPFMIRSSAAPWASTRTLASNTGTRSSSLPCTMSRGRGAR